ncbi:MAG: hypothetical protein HY452_01550 [Parcubacteria group bacterium]|nr:hypothetical protein [Parcubacteria group bacterium]
MLNQKQREVLAEKLADLGNIAMGSLVFGFMVRSEVFNYLSLVIGLVIAFSAYIYAVFLTK